MQLEAQILQSMGPELDLEALERGDAEALAGENLGLFCFFTPKIGPPFISTMLTWSRCSCSGGGDRH